MSRPRQYSLIDRLLDKADTALRTLSPGAVVAERTSPAHQVPADTLTDTPNAANTADPQSSPSPSGPPALSDAERKHIAGLMRINHTGEVCAQALYQGQATTAHLPHIRQAMEEAAREEEDHLAWCEERISELGSAPSKLNPLFYALSYAMGATAGLAGDRWSLGFVSETERQVCRHLENHLAQLPHRDQRSRAILEQMREDELRHAINAETAGGAALPAPVKGAMTLMSKIMTWSTYRI